MPRSLPSLAAQAERILEERTRQLAARPALLAPEQPKLALLVCQVGAELYGLPLAAVAQVVPQGPCARLPGAPAALLGLFGRAGQVFSVLDLGRALGAAPAAGDPVEAGHFLLLRQAPRRLALRADRVLGVAHVVPLAGDAAALPRPDDGHPAQDRAVSGHALLPVALGGGGRLIALLALPRLLQPYDSLPAPAGPEASSGA